MHVTTMNIKAKKWRKRFSILNMAGVRYNLVKIKFRQIKQR